MNFYLRSCFRWYFAFVLLFRRMTPFTLSPPIAAFPDSLDFSFAPCFKIRRFFLWIVRISSNTTVILFFLRVLDYSLVLTRPSPAPFPSPQLNHAPGRRFTLLKSTDFLPLISLNVPSKLPRIFFHPPCHCRFGQRSPVKCFPTPPPEHEKIPWVSRFA